MSWIDFMFRKSKHENLSQAAVASGVAVIYRDALEVGLEVEVKDHPPIIRSKDSHSNVVLEVGDGQSVTMG